MNTNEPYDHKHHRPNDSFYLVALMGGLDGTLDLENGDTDFFLTLREARAHAKREMDGYRLQSVIYECRPVGALLLGRPRYIKPPFSTPEVSR